MLNDELSDLAIFAAIADARSFTRAAAKLGKSQSALSQSVRRLEERLKLRLLTRTTRSVMPTPAGEQLLTTLRPLWTRLRLNSMRSASCVNCRRDRCGSPTSEEARHTGLEIRRRVSAASKALEHDLAAHLPALQTAVRLLKCPRADLTQCLRQRRPDLAGVDQSRDLTQNLTLGSNVCGFHYRPGEHRLQMDRD